MQVLPRDDDQLKILKPGLQIRPGRAGYYRVLQRSCQEADQMQRILIVEHAYDGMELTDHGKRWWKEYRSKEIFLCN